MRMSLLQCGLIYVVGGISLTGALPGAYALLAMVALQCTALGLCVSSYSNSIDGAIRWTYGLILFLSVLSLGPHQFFQGSGGYLAELGQWLRCLSPFAALMSLLGAGDIAGQGL